MRRLKTAALMMLSCMNTPVSSRVREIMARSHEALEDGELDDALIDARWQAAHIRSRLRIGADLGKGRGEDRGDGEGEVRVRVRVRRYGVPCCQSAAVLRS